MCTRILGLSKQAKQKGRHRTKRNKKSEKREQRSVIMPIPVFYTFSGQERVAAQPCEPPRRSSFCALLLGSIYPDSPLRSTARWITANRGLRTSSYLEMFEKYSVLRSNVLWSTMEGVRHLRFREANMWFKYNTLRTRQIGELEGLKTHD
jgi:hypothetical protein